LPGDRPPPIEGGLIQTGGEGTLSATAQVVSLERAAEQEQVSVADRINLSDAEIRKQDADARKWMTTGIVRTFILGNVVTLVALGGLVWLDQTNLKSGLIQPDGRVVDQHVIMTLLGAATVQIGAITVIIARYLFPERPRDK
jgi:hypothetical protein